MFKRFSGRSPRVTAFACWGFLLLLAAGAVALDRLPPIEKTAEKKSDNTFRLPTNDDFNKLDPLNLGGGSKHAKVSARFTRPVGDKPGMLYITAEVVEDWYTYATTQGPGGGTPAAITVDRSNDFRLQPKSEFTADPPAKRYFDDKIFKVEMQEHHGTVTWSIPLEFLPTVKLETLRVTGLVELQVCKKEVSCINEEFRFSAELDDAQFVAAPPDPLGGIGFNQFAAADGKRVRLDASFTAPADGKPGTLTITADIAKGFHIYATTQGKGAGKPAKIDVAKSDKFRLLGAFTADPKPDKKLDDIFKVEVQTHHGRVKWTAPFELLGGAKADGLTITGKVSMQACDEGSCVNVDLDFTARQAGGAKAPAKQVEKAGDDPAQVGRYEDSGFHGVIYGKIRPGSAMPGDTVQLILTAIPSPDWHVYALANRVSEDDISMPTLIVVEDVTGLEVGQTTTKEKPHRHEWKDSVRTYVQHYHEQAVTWTTDIKIPKDAKPGDYTIHGLMGFQTCLEDRCDMPQAASFTATLPVGTASKGDLSLSFTKGKFGDAKVIANARPQNAEMFTLDDLAPSESDNETHSAAVWLLMAFGGGFILNFMPCVLPVIGLKIMSFTQQAGQSRARVLALNFWYTLGMMAVFMVLASLAIFVGLKWGRQMQGPEFNVTMAAIIFVFALSFLGVWEIPIPGFVGSGKAGELAEKEGATAAFTKGIVTTILAVPCTGPLLGPALGWAVGMGQESPLTAYGMFACMGLGMGFPYIVIGAFPKLIRFLPKPGAWMETFKHIMGFVLLATVIWLLSNIRQVYWVVPAVALMIGLWAACWWIDRTPLTANLNKKLIAWVGGAAFATLIGFISFGWLLGVMERRFVSVVDKEISNRQKQLQNGSPDVGKVADAEGSELPWVPLTEERLTDAIRSQQTVLIDFTADW
jgi:thiol:disulfide interchange protein